MLRWLISAAFLFLFYNVTAFGQGASVYWYYMPENGIPLTTVCEGGIPLPDGREVKIMWDANNNGPDISDTPAPLCIDPPLCEQGPAGSCNLNTFTFNGQAIFGQAGYFFTDPGFQTIGAIADPPKFFLRIYDLDGTTPLWTTVVYTVFTGPQDIFIPQTDWACGAGGPQCIVLDAQE